MSAISVLKCRLVHPNDISYWLRCDDVYVHHMENSFVILHILTLFVTLWFFYYFPHCNGIYVHTLGWCILFVTLQHCLFFITLWQCLLFIALKAIMCMPFMYIIYCLEHCDNIYCSSHCNDVYYSSRCDVNYYFTHYNNVNYL